MARPLSHLQRQVLLILLDAEDADPLAVLSPNEIGAKLDLPPVEGGGSGAKDGRGSGHRVFGPAQRIIPVLNGLVYRELVSIRDYTLTHKGRLVAEDLKMRRDTPTCPECDAPLVEGNVSAMWHPPKYPEAPGGPTGQPVPAAMTYTCANGHEWTRSVHRRAEP